MQKKPRKFKVIKNEYVGTRLLGKDPTTSDEDIEIWNEAMRRLCKTFDKPESYEKLAYKKPEYKPEIKVI